MSDHSDRCVLYHAGELGAGERLAFESHLGGCPGCRELLEALSLGSRAAARTRLDLPARGRVRAAGLSRATIAARPLAAVAVAAALAVAAFWPGRPETAPSWKELDGDMARLTLELERLSADIALSESDLEIGTALQGLEREAESLAVRL